MSIFTSLFGDPTNATPLSRFIPYSGWVASNVFTTKTGALGMSMEMEGLEYETLPQDQLERASAKVAAASKPLDHRFNTLHHLIKKRGALIDRREKYDDPNLNHAIQERAEYLEESGLYSIRLFTTILFRPKGRIPFIKSFFEQGANKALTRELRESIHMLQDAVNSYATQLGPLLGVSILDKAGIYEHLCELLNPDIATPGLVPAKDLDYFAGRSEMHRKRKHLEWGNQNARVFSMKREPSQTLAHMLRAVQKIDSNMIVCLEFRQVESDPLAREFRQSGKRIYSQSLSTTQSAINKNTPQLPDKASVEKAEEYNSAIADIRVAGRRFGHCSLISVLFDDDPVRLRKACSQYNHIFTEKDAELIEENLYRLRAFFSILPGNDTLNIRYLLMKDQHYADLCPIYKTRSGDLLNEHLDDEYLTFLESPDGEPHYFNLHVGKVAASLVSGATGSGKTVFMNELIESAQKYDTHTFIVDMGGGYQTITKKYGGTYIRIKLNDRGFRINPFSLPYNPSNVNLIHQFIRQLLDAGKFIPDSEQDKLIVDEIHAVYGQREGNRRLGKLSLGKTLMRELHAWVGNGSYAHFFDNLQDDFRLSRFITWDYTDLEEMPQLLNPLMFWNFHWCNRVVKDENLSGIPKGLYMDEGWRFGGTLMQDLIKTAAKTWRKYNAWLVFATQDEDDLRDTGLLKVLNSACHTKVFLPNPGADLAAYSDSFKLNEREKELLLEMKTGEMLVKTPRESRKLRLRKPPSWFVEYEAQQAGVSEEITYDSILSNT